jgi:hypothetical protein
MSLWPIKQLGMSIYGQNVLLVTFTSFYMLTGINEENVLNVCLMDHTIPVK